MQVQKISNNNQNNIGYNPKFKGEIRIHNRHKNRYFSLNTTITEDKILSDLFNSFLNDWQGIWKEDIFYTKMEPNDLLKYIESFSKKLKGVNLPKPSEPCYADIEYYKPSHINYSAYNIDVDNTFWLKHWFNPADFEYLERK